MSDAPASGGSNVIGGVEVAEARWGRLGCVCAWRLMPMLLMVALAGGCTTGRSPRAPDVRLPQAFDAQAAAGATIALDRWWTVYDDPQLTALVEQALATGFDTRTALARLDEARALRAATLAQLGPQGNIEGSREVRQTEDLGGQQSIDIPGIPPGFSLTPSGRSATANLNFNVSYELDFFGRRSAARRTAEGDFAAARFNAEASRVAVTAEIADTLFQARALAVQVEDARATLRIQEELLRIARIQGQRGLAPTADAARIEADVAQASAQLRDLEAQLRNLRRSLLLLTGNAGASLDTVPVTADLGAIPSPPALIPGDLLVRRPDVREAEARIQSAAGNLTTAELELFPRISLRPGLGLGLQRGTFESTTAFWAFGLGLTLPVLDRPRLLAELRASGARAEQAVLAYERAVQTAYSEADQAMTLLESDRNRFAVLDAGESRARVAFDAARRRYALGLDNLTAVLDAERAWRTIRSAAAAAHAQALRRSVQTFRAFGGGWTPAPAGRLS
ncbi:efflux transporter outer membrane subunit [Sphingosinicella sp. BN140058]|uniref:efflux transporter outer membrane subunit n=1 Tax=Sphingosinicella sp. BN140058 TaxID=1892855 RepID=UPI00101385A5|nr:TolC family protein [Sphingosinicella sp. BN140058]QAY77830.1 TolC family protein [Sphingosinicella sp. BN140058]